MRLDGVLEDPQSLELFFILRDQTSGKETYGAGRFLYSDLPAAELVLDFNKAYNPPCAFTPFATCPLPPPQNWLPVRVEAGEMTYGTRPLGPVGRRSPVAAARASTSRLPAPESDRRARASRGARSPRRRVAQHVAGADVVEHVEEARAQVALARGLEQAAAGGADDVARGTLWGGSPGERTRTA